MSRRRAEARGAHSASGADSGLDASLCAAADDVAAQRADRIRARRRRGRNAVTALLLIVGIALLVYAVPQLYDIWDEYHQNSVRYEQVQDTAGITQQDAQAAANGSDPDAFSLSVDWDALKAINPDVIGWVASPTISVINYPVVWTTDNETYLYRSYDGDPGKYGSIFMDCESDPNLADYHTIIYGHHMRNGSMFARMASYTRSGFVDDNPTIIYATPTKTHVLTVIGAYAQVANEDMRRTRFDDDADYREYVSAQLAKSAFAPKADAAQVGHLYSFITCSYNEQDERTVVLAYEPGA